MTAIKVLPKPPYLRQLWTDNDGAAGGPIIADGLVWTIGSDNAVHGLNPANGKEVASIPFGALREPLPDAVSRRWPAAPCGQRPGLRLHGSGRPAAAAIRKVKRAGWRCASRLVLDCRGGCALAPAPDAPSTFDAVIKARTKRGRLHASCYRRHRLPRSVPGLGCFGDAEHDDRQRLDRGYLNRGVPARRQLWQATLARGGYGWDQGCGSASRLASCCPTF